MNVCLHIDNKKIITYNGKVIICVLSVLYTLYIIYRLYT